MISKQSSLGACNTDQKAAVCDDGTEKHGTFKMFILPLSLLLSSLPEPRQS